MSACGTYAGWNRHQTNGEPPCGPCKAAAAAYMRQRRASTPGARAADRWWTRTRHAALEALAREYPARFSELLLEIRERETTGG